MKKGPQTKLYFRRWGEARRALRERGISPAGADAWRHRIHRDVVGFDCSSKSLTNREIDVVLACFRAIADSDDDAFQVRQLDQPHTRLRWVTQNAAAAAGKTPPAPYLEAIAQRMFQTRLELCDEDQLRKILQAIMVHRRRIEKRS